MDRFEIAVSERFKNLWLRFLRLISAGKRGRMSGEKSGSAAEADAASLYGCMKGSVIVPPWFDLTAPVLDESPGIGGVHCG
jgi:hypothetical protein